MTAGQPADWGPEGCESVQDCKVPCADIGS